MEGSLDTERKGIVRRSLVFVAVATLLVVASATAGATTSVDNIKLTAVNGSDASGQAQIYIFDIEGNTGDAGEVVVFDTQLRNLGVIRGGGSGFYTLWAFTPTMGRQLVHTFNTSGAGVNGVGTPTMFVGVLGDWAVPDVKDILFSEDIRIEIWAESDDGHAGPDGYGVLVMEGELTR